MNTTPKAHALTRLEHLADLGYSVLSHTADEGLKLLASNHAPKLTADDFVAWFQSGDTTLAWFRDNLGAATVGQLDPGPLAKACSEIGPTTIISELFQGARIALVLSHAKDVLEETDLKEAKAAALVLQPYQKAQKEFGITAKELIYLEQVSAGATDDEIATELQLSLRAVKERKRKSIDDLHAQNIGHAVALAKRANLI